MADTPRRTRVAHPRTLASRSPGARSPRVDVAEQTEVGEVLIAGHIRSQLRLGLLIAAGVGAVLGGIVLLLVVLPGLNAIRVAGVPVGWLALAVAVFPVITAAGWAYVRLAERNEDRFRTLLEER